MSYSLSDLEQLSKINEQFQVSTFENESVFQALKRYIENFEKSLDSKSCVGIMLTSFGRTITMSVSEIACDNSEIIVFKGLVDGKESVLIQHVSQLDFLLTNIPVKENEVKKQIGFICS